MKLAFAFPGQGAQKVGLGKEFIHLKPYKETFDLASNLLGEDLFEICQTEKIHDTRYTQVALLTASIATLKLFPKNIKPEMILGLSLGEYTGMVASGAVSLEEFFPIVKARGEKMAAIAKKRPGKMVAVLSDDLDTIKKACLFGGNEGVVAPCNYNTLKQTVIGGEIPAMDAATSYLTEKGIKKMIPLEVSGAFHTPLFQEVTAEIGEMLESLTIEPLIPVLSNQTGKVHEKDTLKKYLAGQISNPVQMVKMSETIHHEGVTHVVEIGCGKVVSGLIKKNQKEIEVTSIDDPNSLEKFLTNWG